MCRVGGYVYPQQWTVDTIISYCRHFLADSRANITTKPLSSQMLHLNKLKVLQVLIKWI